MRQLSHRISGAVSLAAALLTSPVAYAQQPEVNSTYLKEHYTKSEVMISMRDGARLFTAIYSPKDTSVLHPIIMKRTPYSSRPYGESAFPNSIGPSPAFAADDYIVVIQDVRGCYMSEGKFVNMTPHLPEKHGPSDIDESTDCYDTVEWLVENVSNNNGNVGLWGISYPGFYAAASMIDAHPALKASSPQAPVSDWWYDDFHHHGAFFLPHSFWFMSSFGLERPEPTTQRNSRRFQVDAPDGYDFFLDDMGPLKNANKKFLRGDVAFWNEFIKHPNYDQFWQSRNIVPHLSDVAPAVMTVGGWFDAEDLYGPLAIYKSIEEQNPDVFNILVMGPWAHGGWARGAGDRLGDVHFGQETSPFYRENIQKPFFDHFLKGDVSIDLPEAYVFETGANQWRTFNDWPPTQIQQRSMYFGEEGLLSFDKPQRRYTDERSVAYDEYVSDPSKPVPFTESVARGMTREYMTDDQRFASRRPDVLVYQTEPLTEAVTLAGPIVADLWVSTSGTDSDWIVKLIDVHPDGHEDYPEIRDNMRTGGMQMMVRSEVIRGRFRNDPSVPEPFTPNEPTNIKLPLQDVLHTFKPGHRIMVQIQSTWFPLVDRNPQKYVDNIFLADESDFVKATQRVYWSTAFPTKLVVGVLP